MTYFLRRQEQGQALVEQVISLPLAFSVVSVLLGLSYFGFARAWIGYQCDQILFCSATPNSQDCEETARRNTRRFLPWGDLDLQLHRERLWTRIDWRWRGLRIRREKILKWDSRLWR